MSTPTLTEALDAELNARNLVLGAVPAHLRNALLVELAKIEQFLRNQIFLDGNPVNPSRTSFIDLPNGSVIRASTVVRAEKDGERSIVIETKGGCISLGCFSEKDRDHWLACIVAQLKAEK